MGRAPCCDKENVKKGPWSPDEDSRLKDYIHKYGTGGNWIALPLKAGLKRCGKSCRLRWLNYLRPNIKHGEFSDDEDRIICSLFANIGSRWSIIAAQLPGRTDNDIKNYWNTKLKKKIMGIVPSSDQQKPPQSHFSSPLPSLSSSYKESNTTCYIPSNLLTNTTSTTTTTTTTTTSLVQPQESLMGPIHHYQVKDSLLMFGGEPSCSFSDVSCIQISYGKETQHDIGVSGGDCTGGHMMNLESNFYNGVEDQNQNLMLNEFLGMNPLDYGLEEIKQLVSNNNACNNFFIDHENVMYY